MANYMGRTLGNLRYGSLPGDTSGGSVTSKKKVYSHLDPFNLTGWQNKQGDVRGEGSDILAMGSLLEGRPEYRRGYDPSKSDEQNIREQFASDEGFDKLKSEALRNSRSPWATMAMQKQYAEEMDARERAKQEAASGVAAAESQLAMRGGLSSGARERLATQGAQNSLAMSQQVGRQGNLNRMGVDVQDQANRLGQLQALTGLEGQRGSMLSAARDRDIARQTDEAARRNLFNMNLYQEQMKDRAANLQANATLNAGKK